MDEDGIRPTCLSRVTHFFLVRCEIAGTAAFQFVVPCDISASFKQYITNARNRARSCSLSRERLLPLAWPPQPDTADALGPLPSAGEYIPAVTHLSIQIEIWCLGRWETAGWNCVENCPSICLPPGIQTRERICMPRARRGRAVVASEPAERARVSVPIRYGPRKTRLPYR